MHLTTTYNDIHVATWDNYQTFKKRIEVSNTSNWLSYKIVTFFLVESTIIHLICVTSEHAKAYIL